MNHTDYKTNAKVIAATENILNTIDAFYSIDGIEGPLETITHLLQEIFQGLDDIDTNDKGEPEYRYKLFNQAYVSNTVFMTCEMIKLFSKLNDENNKIKWAKSQESIN